MERLAPDRNSELLLDLENEQLWLDGEAVTLPPKSFAMLCYFVTSPKRLQTKDSLLKAMWPGRYVTGSPVKIVVQQLRRALGDNPRSPRYIETVHRRGYRYIGSIKIHGL